MQSTFAPSFPTQLNSNILPTLFVSQSSVVTSGDLTRRTSTKSVRLLSTVLTYTSIDMPSSTSVPVVIDATSTDIVVTSSHVNIATTSTAVTTSYEKSTFSTSTADVIDDRTTLSSVNAATTSAAVTTHANTNTLSAIATDNSNGRHFVHSL